jgi:hypothetical protein
MVLYKIVFNCSQSNLICYSPGQSRLSRSSVDLRSQSSQSAYARQDIPLRRQGSISAYHQPARQSMSHPEIPTSVQIFQHNPPDESIYKWKFNDDPPLVYKNGDNNNLLSSQNQQSLTSLAPSQPSPQCHRVEYLPCDGICAEETYVNIVNHTGNPESARSTSSRTSRGCNTEETRIFAETKVQQQIQEQQEQPLQKPFYCRGLVLGQNGNGASNEDLLSQALNSRGDSGLPQQRRHFPMNGLSNSQGTLHQDQSTQKNTQPFKNERNFYPFNGGAGDLEVQMKNMSVGDSGRQVVNKSNNNKQQKDSQGAGDFPHAPGTVPK